MVEMLVRTIRYVLTGNKEVIQKRLKKYGYDAFGKAATLSAKNKDLAKLFKDLQKRDKIALDQLKNLKKAGIRDLIAIFCKMFNAKTKLINNYIKKHSK